MMVVYSVDECPFRREWDGIVADFGFRYMALPPPSFAAPPPYFGFAVFEMSMWRSDNPIDFKSLPGCQNAIDNVRKNFNASSSFL